MYYINIDNKRWEFICENTVRVSIKRSSLEDDFAVHKSVCSGSGHGFPAYLVNFEVQNFHATSSGKVLIIRAISP